ncbi:hypothetical protein SAMN05444166_6157 [Singulisphaera sp. GP187]|uniref:hypothetical protein n=1 Tax=Singulisphaera sp. GP187 TaxID=1882752 RepID=UPI000928B90D|nr:hypothetical protein [Singulisphaera sp. GP187]SIO59742.1 hypothetical protein SAMN05444166_6157 [Singulisphaera sp. GP187]
MKSTKRSDRPDSNRLKLGSSLEALEPRTVLSTVQPFTPWIPTDLPVYTAVTHKPIAFSIDGLVDQARTNPQAQFLNSRGKIVSGKDRQRNEWTITVHGPGSVLVTDSTPNDGILDDNIDTIQLIGTDPNRTYVTAQTTASAFTPTDGTVLFNKLVSTTGVKSIILNGFTLTQTVAPPEGTANNSDTGIFLTGGVGLLQFHNILGTFDTATSDLTTGAARIPDGPINIVIGDPSTRLKVAPTIRMDSIFNTVIDSTGAQVATNPQVNPTVNFLVNGELHGLEIVSSTQHPYVDPAQQLNGVQTIRGPVGGPTLRYTNPTLSPIASAGTQNLFPIVGSTGRTAVRATGIGQLKSKAGVTNVTASRGAVPFQNGFSGLNHLKKASFGANADALGLDVNGRIGSLKFKKGLGSPVGDSASATQLGIPEGQTGYPAAGLQGGLVTASRIGRLKVLAANSNFQTASNPDFVQLNRQGYTTYFARPGNALTSSAIVSSGSIGKTQVVGTTVNSEIKGGFHYPSFAAGLEGTRSRSKVGPVAINGDLASGVVSSTVRPGANNVYGNVSQVAGPGQIRGHSNSTLYATSGTTPLNNKGTGYFARVKSGGYLPPPSIHRKVSSAQF